jgi:hypothetical protein
VAVDVVASRRSVGGRASGPCAVIMASVDAINTHTNTNTKTNTNTNITNFA